MLRCADGTLRAAAIFVHASQLQHQFRGDRVRHRYRNRSCRVCEIHLERAKRERLSCVMRQRLARLYPHAQQYTSMIIDGADTTVRTNLL